MNNADVWFAVKLVICIAYAVAALLYATHSLALAGVFLFAGTVWVILAEVLDNAE